MEEICCMLSFESLELAVELMYKGAVEVDECQLAEFLEAIKQFEVDCQMFHPDGSKEILLYKVASLCAKF